MSAKQSQARFLWPLLLIPGIAHLVLLCIAMFSRLSYPYDLEWMEGGLLAHAQRIADGSGIYVEPSTDFVPFLSTPLYPGVMALFSDVTGIGYGVGRGISILATLGLCALFVLMVRRESEDDTRALAWIGGASAVGLFAATYPWVEGWYDLVRADSMFMLMVVGGLFGIRCWARDPGQGGLAKVACAAAVLGFSFFAKQTGILFVATGGLMILVLNWRRVPVFVAVTGVIGLGGTWLLNKVTVGWFWVYIYETHQHHDFNMDRFYQSFENILWHFPWMTALIACAILLLLVTLARCRRLPSAARGLAIWFPVFVVSVFVGALGWGTQFAHFNAYVPAMVFGALCAGLALPATAACLQLLVKGSDAAAPSAESEAVEAPPSSALAQAAPKLVAYAFGLGLTVQLALSWWDPQVFIPSEQDRQAGDRLVEIIQEVEGDVLIPYHPWYAALAGKPLQVHLMGLRDMTTGKVWPIAGLDKSIQEQRYAAIIMDNRPFGRELSMVKRYYRMDDYLKEASPHVFTGAGAVWNRKVQTLVPRSIWVPNQPVVPPENARVLWSFEDGKLGGWALGGQGKHKRGSSAWGRGPVSRSLPKQGPVLRYGGRFYLSSFHGGDAATGTLRSPQFPIDGSTLSFRVSGGASEHLRVELRIGGQVVKSATGTGGERMDQISWSVAAYAGKIAEIVLIDDDKGSWGHLNADEFWMWD